MGEKINFSDMDQIRNININNIRYDESVDENDIVVQSVRALGFLADSEPLVVVLSKEKGKYDLMKGRKRLYGARLRGDVITLPCRIVNDTLAKKEINLSKNKTFEFIDKYIFKRESLCFYLVEVLNLVHTSPKPPKKLPLRREHFLFLETLTGDGLTTIQRGLSGLRIFYGRIPHLDKNVENSCIRDIFLNIIESNKFPTFTKFYRGEISAFSFCESVKEDRKKISPAKSSVDSHINASLNDKEELNLPITKPAEIELFEKLTEISSEDSRGGFAQMDILIKSFLSKNPNKTHWFFTLAKAIVSQYPSKFDKNVRDKITYKSLDLFKHLEVNDSEKSAVTISLTDKEVNNDSEN